MAGTINKVILIGNVGKEPEIKLTQEGKEIAILSLATSETWNDKTTGERREKTEWHRITVFVPHIVNIVKKYVRKGSKLYIEGSLQTRKWFDDKSSVERYTTEILLQSFNSTLMLMDNKSSGSSNENEGDGRHMTGSDSSKGNGAKDEGFSVEEMDDEVAF